MSSARLRDNRRHNFFLTDNEVVDDYIERVPENRRADALAVYSVLSRHANETGVAWPGVEYIGRKIGRSRPTVIDAIKELGRVGLLGKEERFDASGQQKTNHYLLLSVEKGGVNRIDTPPKQDLPPGVNRIDTKKTHKKKTVEANASSGTGGSAVGLEKYVTDGIYRAMASAGYALDNSDFGYHLGRAKAMLEKMEPSDAEIEALPDGCVAHFEIRANTDAMAGLRYMRQQKARAERISADREADWRTREPVNPHSPRPQTLTEDELAERRKEREELGRMMREAMERDAHG